MNIRLLLLVAVFFSSCTSNSQRIIEEYRQSPPFPIIVLTEGEVLPLDLMAPSQILDLGDYLVACMFKDAKAMIHVFDGSNYELLAKVFSKGRGPNEAPAMGLVSQKICTHGENALWVMGMPIFFGKLNLKKSIDEQKPVFDEMFNFFTHKNPQMLLQSNIPYHRNGNELWMLMDPERSGDWAENVNPYYISYDFEQGASFNKTYVSNFAKPEDRNDYNLIRFIAGESTRTDFKKSVIAYRYMDRFNIIDLDSKEILVIGTDGIPPKKISSSYMKEKYNGLCSTDRRIILLGMDKSVNGGKNYFDIFDWEGNPIVRILVDEKEIMSPNISHKGMLYCIYSEIENGVEKDKIIRYNFSPYL